MINWGRNDFIHEISINRSEDNGIDIVNYKCSDDSNLKFYMNFLFIFIRHCVVFSSRNFEKGKSWEQKEGGTQEFLKP